MADTNASSCEKKSDAMRICERSIPTRAARRVLEEMIAEAREKLAEIEKTRARSHA